MYFFILFIDQHHVCLHKIQNYRLIVSLQEKAMNAQPKYTVILKV